MSESPGNKNAPSAVEQLRIQRQAAPAGRRRSRKYWIAIAVAVAVAAGVIGMPRKATVQAVSVVSTTPSQQYAVLTASGYVVAQRRAAISSKASGRLEYLSVAEGSRVKAGELIARIDARDVAAQLASAQAAVGAARAGLATAEVELRNAQDDFKRQKSLVDKGFVSASALDNAQARLDRALAAVNQARAGLDASRANANAAAVNRDFTEIRAPFDGVVLVKNANVGDNITPMSGASGSLAAVVTMADMSSLEVEADVSESSLAKVTIGMPVEILLDALPDARFRGTVGRIVPTVDRAKATVMTKIRFDRIDERILPEMSAKVTFLSRPIGEADQRKLLAVNPDALVEREGRTLALRIVKKDDVETVEEVELNRGNKVGDVVEITGKGAGAVASGDRLVLKPDARLKAGAKVVVAGR